MGGFGGVPPGSGGAPPPAGGGGGNPPDPNVAADTLNDLKSSVDSVAAARAWQTIVDNLTKVGVTAETAEKKFEKFHDRLRGGILVAENTAEALKVLSSTSKDLAKTLAQGKSLENTKKLYEGMIKEADKLIKSQKLSGEQMKIMQRESGILKGKFEELGKATEATFSEDMFEGATKGAIRFTKTVEKAAQAVNEVKMGPLTRGVASTRRNLIDAGVMKAGRFEKYAAYGEAAVKLKAAGKAKREEKQADFELKRESARKSVMDIPGMSAKFKSAGLIDANGLPDWDKIAKRKKEFAKVAGAAGGDVGATMQDLSAAGAPKMGLMSRIGLGGGAVESAVGSVAQLAGQAAIPLAIAEAVKDLVVSLIDKNAKMNRQAETLAGGGLFTGGGTANEDFMAARENLSPLAAGNLYSRYGLTREKNVAMARGIIGAGYNIESTFGGGVGGQKGGDEFGPGSFGEIQKISAVQGRIAGMGDEQSVNLVMKSLMQYRESMEGTQQFFTNLNKDTRAAGISATKYVSIIDELLGHFDRMNKSLDQVTGTLRVLSRTGRSTSEDLQATMGMLTGAGRQQFDLASAGYVATQMKGGGGTGLKTMQAGQEAALAGAAENVQKALKDVGLQYSIPQITKMLGTAEGRDQLRSQIDTAQGPAGKQIDVSQRIAAQGAVNQASSMARGLDITRDYMAGRMSAVDYGSAMLSKGMSPQEQTAFRQQAMTTIMQKSGYSLRDIADQKKPIDAKLKLMLEQALPGFQPDDTATLAKGLQDAASARFDIAANPEQYIPTGDKLKDEAGAKAMDEKNNQRAKKTAEEIARVLPEFAGEVKGVDPNDQQGYIKLMRKWSHDPANPEIRGKMIHAMEDTAENVEALHNPFSDAAKGIDKLNMDQKKAAEEEKVKQAAMVTRDMAEIFDEIFGVYFTKIIGLISKIWDVIGHSTLLGGVSKANEEQGGEIYDSMKEAVDAAKAGESLRLAWLKKQQDATNDPAQRANIQKMIDEDTAKLSSLSQAYGVGSGKTGADAEAMAQIARDSAASANEPMVEALKSANVKLDDNMSATLTDEQYKQQADLYSEAVRDGLAEPVKKIVDATTGKDTYQIHIINNSASLNYKAGLADKASTAIETAQAQADGTL
jgi:hypothetical protein